MNRALAALLAAAALGLAACGDDPKTGGSATEAPNAPPVTNGSSGGDATADGDLALSADPSGSLAYEQASAEVGAGGAVTLDFTNESDVIHDVTVERDGEEIGATERVTEGSTSTKLDLEPGEYTFYCSITGHRGAGMEGTLTVR